MSAANYVAISDNITLVAISVMDNDWVLSVTISVMDNDWVVSVAKLYFFSSAARPARTLSLLALSKSKLAQHITTYSRSARHACWACFRKLRNPKVFKTLRIERSEHTSSVRRKEEGTKATKNTFSSCFYHFLSFQHHFTFVLSPPC